MSNSRIYFQISFSFVFFVFSGNSFHFLKVSVYEVPIKGRNGPSGEYFGQNMYESGRTKAKRMASKIEPMEAYKAKAALFPGQAIALRA